jgi:predicted nucleotidyltransferase component of viral defense system
VSKKLPIELRRVIPPDTQIAWETLVGNLPASAYLIGGTAVTVYLQHRESQDLDFYLSEPEDLGAVNSRLARLTENWAASNVKFETLKGYLGATKVELFHAVNEANSEPPKEIAGIPVASQPDLFAIKLGAITRRPALRDYFDLMETEKRVGLSVEEGIGLYLARNHVSSTEGSSVATSILFALGEAALKEAVEIDPSNVPERYRKELLRYWPQRQKQIARFLDRFAATSELSTEIPTPIRESLEVAHERRNRSACRAWMPRANARCILPKGHAAHHRSVLQ